MLLLSRISKGGVVSAINIQAKVTPLSVLHIQGKHILIYPLAKGLYIYISYAQCYTFAVQRILKAFRKIETKINL
jgi:hypothetical protein